MPKCKIDNVDLYYEVKGEGVPIVFIHPPLLTSANFTYQLEHLSKKYKIITFDIRGHGNSGYSKQSITYSLIVEDMIALLNTLKIHKAFFCGYSTGGSVVLELLQSYSERAFGGIVLSGLSEVNDQVLKLRIMAAIKLSKGKTLPFLTRVVTNGNSATPHTYKKLLHEALKGDARNIRQYYEHSLTYNCTNQLTNIQTPVLLLYGQGDQAFHKYAQILHQKLPNNELYFIRNTKHQIPTKAPHALHEAIHQFIQSYKESNPFMI